MLKEFKEFALKGNAIELAVGVVVGTAFQTIIKSLVNDVIMPLISVLFGNTMKILFHFVEYHLQKYKTM